MTTVVAANVGGPNVPKSPNSSSYAVASSWTAGSSRPVMSGANDDTYDPAIEKSSGEKSPSEPKMTASLPCSDIWLPKSWALAAICQGRNTTSVSPATPETSAEKSVWSWLTDSRSTVTPASSSASAVESARPVEYEVWSSMMSTFWALSSSAMYVASVGPWSASVGTTRKKVSNRSVRSVAVAEGDTKAMPSRPKISPTASTSWLPAGPTMPKMSLLETNCGATVEAWAGSSCVSPSSRTKSVPFSSLKVSTANLAQFSCSWPIEAASPVNGPMTPIEPEHSTAAGSSPSVAAGGAASSSSSPPHPVATTARAAITASKSNQEVLFI